MWKLMNIYSLIYKIDNCIQEVIINLVVLGVIKNNKLLFLSNLEEKIWVKCSEIINHLSNAEFLMDKFSSLDDVPNEPHPNFVTKERDLLIYLKDLENKLGACLR